MNSALFYGSIGGYVTILLINFASSACAAELIATPTNWKVQYAAAKSGDTLKFVGTFATRTDFHSRVFFPTLKIDTSQGVFLDSMAFRNVTGVHLRGGVFGNLHGRTGQGGAIVFFDSSNVHVDRIRAVGPGTGTGAGIAMMGVVNGSVSNSTFTSLNTGITVGKMSREIRILNNFIELSTSDGINISSSHGVVASYNYCHRMKPLEKAHPDCLQMWSVKENPVQSDIEVSYNTSVGFSQGFTSFNPEDGGLLRANIVHNRVDGPFVHGIACYACVDSKISNNVISSFLETPWQTRITVIGGKNVRVVGNSISPKGTRLAPITLMPMKMPGNPVVGYSVPTSNEPQSAGYWPAIPRSSPALNCCRDVHP